MTSLDLFLVALILLVVLLWIAVRREQARAAEEGRLYKPPFGERIFRFVVSIFGS